MSAPIDSVRPLLSNPKRFQQLTSHDSEIYGQPLCFRLDMPTPRTTAAREKLDRWFQWRAASYEASRHSEYLFVCDQDIEDGPRILVSAILDLSDGVEEYLRQFNNTQRRKITGRKPERLGYTSQMIEPRLHAREIAHVVNSARTRQGREIAERYARRSEEYTFPEYVDYGDPNFNDICMGVFSPKGGMVAYLLGKRVGDHVQYDEIMGHLDHLQNDVMYLLHYSFVKHCFELEVSPTCLNYGPWYSGSNPYSAETGVNFWKRKVRLRPGYLMIASSSADSRGPEPHC